MKDFFWGFLKCASSLFKKKAKFLEKAVSEKAVSEKASSTKVADAFSNKAASV